MRTREHRIAELKLIEAAIRVAICSLERNVQPPPKAPATPPDAPVVAAADGEEERDCLNMQQWLFCQQHQDVWDPGYWYGECWKRACPENG